MNITLTASLADFVRSKVETGGYSSEDEVIQESLRLWEQRESAWKKKVSEQIDQGLDDLQADRTLSPAESEAKMAEFKAQWRSRQVP